MTTLLRQMDMGSLACAQIWVRVVLTKGGPGTNKSAHLLTRRRIKMVSYPTPSGDRTQDLHDALTIELRPQSVYAMFSSYLYWRWWKCLSIYVKTSIAMPPFSSTASSCTWISCRSNQQRIGLALFLYLPSSSERLNFQFCFPARLGGLINWLL